METYKKNVIDFVRDRPLLWDPANKDYTNKEQRKIAWEEIDRQLRPPGASNLKAKDIWDQMTRGFSNALRRKDKRSCSGAGNERDWKFEKDMVFLLPVKKLRKSSGLPETDNLDTCINEDSWDLQSQPETENSMEHEKPEAATEIGEEIDLMNAYRPLPQKKLKRAGTDDDDTITNAMIKLMKQRHMEKANESHRLNFFRSLMPAIDSLSEDQFLNLQIDVIQAVQKQKQAPPHMTNQPPLHSAESSVDS